MEVSFLILSTHNSAYNVILERLSLNKIRAIVSAPHLLMKFLTNQGIGQIQADQQMAKWCYMASLTKKHKVEQSKDDWSKLSDQTLKACQMINSKPLNVRGDNEQQPKPKFDLEDIWIYGENDEWVICIGDDLHPDGRN